MKRILFILFTWICCTLSVSAQQTDQLENTILIRPNDILYSLSGWNSFSTSGFSYQLNSNLYGYYGTQPTFYMDGIPVDISYFGWQNLNMLPLIMEQIDSLTYVGHPAVYKQTFAGAGYVDLQTTAIDTGLHVAGSVFFGNEAGDPGPWIYDSTRITPNVDRWGPDLAAQVSYNGGNWYVRSLLSRRKHIPTDIIMRRRISYELNTDRNDREPQRTFAIARTGLLEAGYRSKKWDVSSRLIGSRNDEFIFFHPYGRELPAFLEYRQVALQTAYRPSDWKFILRYTNDLKEINHRAYRSDYEFGWEERTHQLSFSVRRSSEKANWSSGLNYKVKDAEGPSVRFNPKMITSFHSSLQIDASENINVKVEGNADLHDQMVAPTGQFNVTSHLSEYWIVTNRLLYSELLPVKQNSISYWTQQGYSLLGQLEIPYQVGESINLNRLFRYGMEHLFNLDSSLNLKLGAEVTKHLDLNIPRVNVSYHPTLHTTSDEYSQYSENGTRGQIHLRITHIPTNKVTQKLTAHFFKTWGSERYRSYWEETPGFRLEYFLSVKPVQDLVFNLRASWRGSSRWDEYDSLEGERYQSGILGSGHFGTFHTKTPSHLNIELSARKWLWNEKLTTTFSIRNLLNQELRMHPMGAELSLLFYIKATLRL